MPHKTTVCGQCIRVAMRRDAGCGVDEGKKKKDLLAVALISLPSSLQSHVRLYYSNDSKKKRITGQPFKAAANALASLACFCCLQGEREEGRCGMCEDDLRSGFWSAFVL